LKNPARRRDDPEQEVLELNSKLPVRMREKEKEETRSNRLSLRFPPRGNVKNKDLLPLQALAGYTNVGY
jgi:hypothetical protein